MPEPTFLPRDITEDECRHLLTGGFHISAGGLIWSGAGLVLSLGLKNSKFGRAAEAFRDESSTQAQRVSGAGTIMWGINAIKSKDIALACKQFLNIHYALGGDDSSRAAAKEMAGNICRFMIAAKNTVSTSQIDMEHMAVAPRGENNGMLIYAFLDPLRLPTRHVGDDEDPQAHDLD